VNAYALAAIPPALLLIARPQLWPWALAVAAFVALAALGAAAHHFRNERDDARAERDRLERELEARPRLRLVPRQRDGSEYEWPRLARQIEDDDLTALMRATEEK
jgi:histidinol-phosphate/aromatic aminotransferase/cobyric acid decarboxylase-like protein